MGRGLCVVVNDKPENKETLGNTGIYFNLNTKDLSEVIKNISKDPQLLKERGKKSQQRAILLYNWDKIGYEYFKLIKKLTLSTQELMSQSIHALRRIDSGEQKILITGAGGMLGEAFYKHFKKNYTVEATDIDLNESWLSHLDIRDFKAYHDKVKSFHPHYIFHLAALTSLEECEQSPANAYSTNALSAKYAAQLSSHYGIKLVYISSAGVFDGQREYYTDDDEPNPVNVYGLTKQMGAFMVEYYAPPDHLVIRPGWMIGGGPQKDKKFVGLIMKQLMAGTKEINAVNDKFGTPSYTHDLARTLYLLIKKDATGIYNMVCNGEPVSRFEIAKEIVSILGLEKKVKVNSVPSSFFQKDFFAIRPRYENLLNRRLTLEGNNIMRPWQAALKEYLERYFPEAFKKK
jgi:dTDP-4-dehydrorhamnose reductase